MDYLSLGIGITALMWTIYQQYGLSQLCKSCPYFPPNVEKKI